MRVVKWCDQTHNDRDVPVEDDELVFNVTANVVYRIDGWIRFTTDDPGCGIGLGLFLSVDPSIYKGRVEIPGGGNDGAGFLHSFTIDETTNIGVSALRQIGVEGLASIVAIIKPDDDGYIALQFHPEVDGVDVTIKALSMLEVTST